MGGTAVAGVDRENTQEQRRVTRLQAELRRDGLLSPHKTGSRAAALHRVCRAAVPEGPVQTSMPGPHAKRGTESLNVAPVGLQQWGLENTEAMFFFIITFY